MAEEGIFKYKIEFRIPMGSNAIRPMLNYLESKDHEYTPLFEHSKDYKSGVLKSIGN